MLIEIVENLWLDPFEVKLVRANGENKCTLWITGEGYMEGHPLDYPASEVVEAVNDAMVEDVEEVVEENED